MKKIQSTLRKIKPWYIAVVTGIVLILFLAYSAQSQNEVSGETINVVRPTITSVDQQSLTQEEASYIVELSKRVQQYNAASERFEFVYNRLVTNPNNLVDERWREDFITSVDTMNDSSRAIVEIKNIPPRFEELNNLFISLASEVSLASNAYKDGLNKMDSKMIDDASLHLSNATKKMQEIKDELRRLNLLSLMDKAS